MSLASQVSDLATRVAAEIKAVWVAVNSKAPLANPTFTGTVGGITKSMVGLANVDNTSDASKPVSTAVTTALNAKLSLTQTYFAGHHPEGRALANAFLSNDLGNLRLRGGSLVSITGATMSNAEIDAMFDGTANFASKGIIAPGNPIVMTFSLPRTLNYGATLGIGFGASSWRANTVRIEAFSEGAWKDVVNTTTNTSEELYAGIPGNSGIGTTQIRITLDDAPSGLRICHIWGFNYNSDLWTQLMMPRKGGTFYGPVAMGNNAFTGLPTPTAADHAATKGYVDTADAGKEPLITAGTTSQYRRGDKTWQTLDKNAVGLTNVDNTSDVNKPISTAVSTALSGKEPTVATGTALQYYRGDKTWQALNLAALPDAWVKRSVRVASTANVVIATGGLQTVDGIVLAAGDRVLLKNQTTASENGIYQVNTGAWTRASDANTSAMMAGADVAVDTGTQGGFLYSNLFKATDTLGTTAMNWYRVVDQSMVGAAGGVEAFVATGTTAQYRRGDKTWQTLDKNAVGLGNVPNVDATNAGNLAAGTVPDARLPARLTAAMQAATDWNAVSAPGWYVADPAVVLNAPAGAPSGQWSMADYVGDANNGFLTVTYWVAASSDSDTYQWRRHKIGAVWQPWYKIEVSRNALDARFVGTIERNGTGPTLGTAAMVRDFGFYSEGGSPLAGDIVIQTNMAWNSYMCRLHITGYSYESPSSDIDLTVTFYTYNPAAPQYFNYNVVNKGTVQFSQVRLARRTSDNKPVIILTPASGSWSYPKIRAEGFIAHSNPTDAELVGWTITRTSDLSAITMMVSPTILNSPHTHTAKDISHTTVLGAISSNTTVTVGTTATTVGTVTVPATVGQNFLVTVMLDLEVQTASNASAVGQLTCAGAASPPGLMILKSVGSDVRSTISGTYVLTATATTLTVNLLMSKDTANGVISLRGANSSITITEL